MTKGYLNIVLHAHLPYIRHTDSEHRLEERWLFEAMTEVYIPLLMCFQKLLDDGVEYAVTFSLSPTLISMLADKLLQTRYMNHLDTLIRLADSEIARNQEHPEFLQLAAEYRRRFGDIRAFYEQCEGNLLPVFRRLWDADRLELITSSATHAFLPYVQTDEALHAQIAAAVDVFHSHFGRRPNGIWLPECAYTPRVEPFLRAYGIRYCFVDTHGVTSASPKPLFGTFAPIVTPGGIAAFARDEESSRQVWSSEEGYPGDFDYREYYRDIGFDLDFDYIAPFIHPEGIRVNTGMKYYRITGSGAQKALYNFDWAREKAAIHAGNFLFNRTKQIEHAADLMGRKPIVTAPYDAELFGHWWYEGPIFLDMLFRKMHFDQSVIGSITPSQYLRLYDDFQVSAMSFSTWGRGGFGDVWLNASNDWIYPALHDSEQTMVRMVKSAIHPSPIETRALNQAARELMLAQSSDWAFIMDSKTVVDYAAARTKHHVNRFRALASMVQQRCIDEETLFAMELVDPIFPDIDYRVYQTDKSRKPSRKADSDRADNKSHVRILMLSWEFPPMTVGGLSRHVYDLSRYLVQIGCEVHVVTTAVGEYPLDEVVQGVKVHRVRVLQPDGERFVDFAFQLNLAMMDRCHELIEDERIDFDVVHAHDWLVAHVAKDLKYSFGLPLLVTIHATEHGRNGGIFTDTHRHIHGLEWMLTYEANRVIVCSTQMSAEVQNVFQLPADKIDVLPNGVDTELFHVDKANMSVGKEPFAKANQPLVVYVGRLVREKGIHLLIEAAKQIVHEFPDVQFAVMGRGPYENELRQLAQQHGIAYCVHFPGFVDDETRNRVLDAADVAVFPSLYEPFGIVALEAMAAKTPVIVADVGGLGDLVQHGYNGLKMFPNDAASLAQQLCYVLSHPKESRILADTASMEMVRFDWGTIAKDTLRIYQTLTNRVQFEAVQA